MVSGKAGKYKGKSIPKRKINVRGMAEDLGSGGEPEVVAVRYGVSVELMEKMIVEMDDSNTEPEKKKEDHSSKADHAIGALDEAERRKGGRGRDTSPERDKRMGLNAIRKIIENSDSESSILSASAKLIEKADKDIANRGEKAIDIPLDESVVRALKTDFCRLLGIKDDKAA